MEDKKEAILLDEIKRREIRAILSMGCTRRAAARYVGCTPSMITTTAARDEAFRRDLQRAEQTAEIEYMRNIQEAAKKSQYWRAAAWALERRRPQDYAARRADSVTIDQVHQLLAQCTEIIIEEVPAATQRKKLLYRLEKLTAPYSSDKPDS